MIACRPSQARETRCFSEIADNSRYSLIIDIDGHTILVSHCNPLFGKYRKMLQDAALCRQECPRHTVKSRPWVHFMGIKKPANLKEIWNESIPIFILCRRQ